MSRIDVSLLQQETEVDLKISALLPDDYIFDVNTRLSLYKRVASCLDAEQIDELQVELIDRFGLLPQPAKNLFAVQGLKLEAQALGISKIEANAKGGFIEFTAKTKVDPRFIIGLLQSNPKVYRMEGANKLRFSIEEADSLARLKLASAMLQQFAQKVSN